VGDTVKLPFRIRSLILLPACLCAYLAIVGGWAWVNFDDVLANASVDADAQLSARQTAILTRVEDPAFFTHRGVSLARGQGLATMSSALARELYLQGADLPDAAGALQHLYRAVFVCCKKVDLGRDVMAVVLDARLSKQRQLALYVARVYMGTDGATQVRGLPQAERHYLNKPLEALTDDEFIGLVAMIKAPNRFHPFRQRVAYDSRVARVRALVSGRCEPDGWFDTELAHCHDGG
jgi:membrane carboxypeptidase/penicillin-binding protein